MVSHEELLAKVNEIYVDYLDVSVDNGIKALRAVVELHKDDWFESMSEGEPMNHRCESCIIHDYPCPTIQIIMKELK